MGLYGAVWRHGLILGGVGLQYGAADGVMVHMLSVSGIGQVDNAGGAARSYTVGGSELMAAVCFRFAWVLLLFNGRIMWYD